MHEREEDQMSDKRDLEAIIAYRKLATMGITTIRQAMLLIAINYQDTITTLELGRTIGIARPNAGQLAAQLQEKGLLGWTEERQARGKHKRVYFLTPKGKEAVELAKMP